MEIEELRALYGEGREPDAFFHDAGDETAEGTPSATKHARATTVTVDADIRCSGTVDLRGGPKTCNKLLARQAGRPWIIECPRCRTVNRSQSTP